MLCHPDDEEGMRTEYFLSIDQYPVLTVQYPEHAPFLDGSTSLRRAMRRSIAPPHLVHPCSERDRYTPYSVPVVIILVPDFLPAFANQWARGAIHVLGLIHMLTNL
jgi:hypothetical protein